jgi:Putative prokaryotic signal transducing protein
MPLVHMPGSERDTSERQRKARKIKPQYSEGRLVKVAYATNQPEAELIEALLLEEGIPSMSRRAGGFDVPDFLAAGPRDILVPESGAEAAREALVAPPASGRSGEEAEAEAQADAEEAGPARG